MDQRSTGFSSGPLDCSAEIAGALTELAADAEATFEDADSHQLAISDAAISACLDVFEERGADISQVNTESNAHGVALLAQALGYEDFSLFGISYGTRLALEVMLATNDRGPLPLRRCRLGPPPAASAPG